MEEYKYDQMISNNNLNQQQQMVGSFRIYDQSGQADPTVRSGVASTSKFCDPYPFPQGNEMETIKAKIMAHPHYSSLLQAYLDCYQVGAPPDVVARLAAAYREFEATRQPTWGSSTNRDPELDHFMETYYDMLVRYREALRRPIQEATDFMRRIETQLNVLVSGTAAGRIFDSDDKYDQGVGSSEEDEETSTWGEKEGGEEIDPRAEDRQLRNQLLRKYSGRLSSLRQELSKKKKKGKLPKEAREKLFSWWQSHHRWPYPSESEKLALAEATSLDQKQINNWFINQRKRHWKPSEDMQLMVMDGQQQAQTAVLYMDGHYMPDHGPTYHLRP